MILALERLSADTVPKVEKGTAEFRLYQISDDMSALLTGTRTLPERLMLATAER